MAEPHILTDLDDRGVARVTFNRVDVHNAINDEVIAELTGILTDLDANPAARFVVLAANGKSFCAGGDLNWMLKTANYSFDENLEDARGLGALLRILNGMAKPTVGLVQGAAYGGGVGITACCDIAIAGEAAKFCLSEVKLGLLPATISPYVVRKIGEAASRRYFLSAEVFGAAEAARIGLVAKVVPNAELEAAGEAMIAQLSLGGPMAQAASKELIATVAHGPVDQAMVEYTARRIAEVRATDEGKEGAGAFIDKRKPNWVKE